jgi:tRNA modification GTPase
MAVLQTPPGRGGIAVISLSGPGAMETLEAIFRPVKSHAAGGEGVLQLGHVVADSRVIDEAVVVSRGQAFEINIHGGPAVAMAVMELLAGHGATIAPAPPAAPESFPPAHPSWDNPAVGTEMLQAIPLARSTLAMEALSRQWSGGLSALVSETIRRIDAGECEPAAAADTVGRLRLASTALSRMNRLLNPPEIVLAGPPNVGKSTLANTLVGRCVSIVHHTPGTTRDWVRELAILDGAAVWITDTAGLLENAQGIDAEAVARARQRAEAADLVLLLGADDERTGSVFYAKKLLRLAAKADIRPPAGDYDLAVSSVTGRGIERLRRAVLEALDLADVDPTSPMAFTPRQAEALESAAGQLDRHRFHRAKEILIGILR